MQIDAHGEFSLSRPAGKVAVDRLQDRVKNGVIVWIGGTLPSSSAGVQGKIFIWKGGTLPSSDLDVREKLYKDSWQVDEGKSKRIKHPSHRTDRRQHDGDNFCPNHFSIAPGTTTDSDHSGEPIPGIIALPWKSQSFDGSHYEQGLTPAQRMSAICELLASIAHRVVAGPKH